MLTDDATIYRFGEFTLDVSSGDLLREGRATHLQPQPLLVLFLLLRESGRVVTRQELRSSLWPQDTYVEFDDGLNHAIRRLREALSDTAQVPRYIETVPRRGYRFIAPVHLEASLEHTSRAAKLHAVAKNRAIRLSFIGFLVILTATFILILRHRSLPRIESLAVLPLANFSSDPDQEYFADGITEELTTELSRSRSLRVISRTSSMRLKNTKMSLREIGKELGVDAVIEGSVQRFGDRVRISAQLVQLPTERHVWADTYERDLKDVLRVRSEVAGNIAVEVRTRLALPARQADAINISPEAYDSYLLGTRLANQGSAEDYEKSITYLERAVALEPRFAPAYSQLAESHAILAFWSSSRGDDFKKAVAYSREAVRLDPTLPNAKIADADLKFYWEWDWSQCGAAFREAAESYPNSEDAQYHYGLCLFVLGQYDEALKYLRAAHQLNPLSPMLIRMMSRLLLVMHRDQEALDLLLQARDLEPDASDPYALLALLYPRIGKPSEAVAAYIDARRLSARPASELKSLDRAYRVGGIAAFQKERQRKLRAELKLLLAQKPPPLPRTVATLCASIPDLDCAMHYLEKAYDDRDPMLTWLKSSLAWEPLRDDQRYRALVRRLGLPES